MLIRLIAKPVIAISLMAISAFAMSDGLRFHYSLNNKINIANQDSSTTEPPATEDSSPPEDVSKTFSGTLGTSPGLYGDLSSSDPFVTGDQGTYTILSRYRITINSITFEDITGAGASADPVIISQACNGSAGDYVCTLTVEATDKGGSGDIWGRDGAGMGGLFHVSGLSFVPQSD